MRKQALVIGLGQFGMGVVESMNELNVEVLAVDSRSERVKIAAPIATEVAVFDATDEASLAKVAPAKRDVCVCAIGDESKEASILCTALLKQLGASRIFARASNELHARILKLVGAHEVTNPERAFGRSIALHLTHDRVQTELPIGMGLVVSEVALPLVLAGRALAGLQLRAEHHITVVAIQRGTKVFSEPDPNAPLVEGDRLVVVATREALTRFAERFG